jgi:hypothetical protein
MNSVKIESKPTVRDFLNFQVSPCIRPWHTYNAGVESRLDTYRVESVRTWTAPRTKERQIIMETVGPKGGRYAVLATYSKSKGSWRLR